MKSAYNFYATINWKQENTVIKEQFISGFFPVFLCYLIYFHFVDYMPIELCLLFELKWISSFKDLVLKYPVQLLLPLNKSRQTNFVFKIAAYLLRRQF